MSDFDNNQPPTEAELSGAFHLFMRVPLEYHTAYFAQLLCIPRNHLATMLGTTMQNVQQQHEMVENILYGSLDIIVRDELKYWENPDLPAPQDVDPAVLMVRNTLKLIKPHPVSDMQRRKMHDYFRGRVFMSILHFLNDYEHLPPEMSGLKIPVQNALELKERFYEKERQTNIRSQIKNIPLMTHAEMREARLALNAMPPSLRKIFIMVEVANLQYDEIATYSRTSPDRIEEKSYDAEFHFMKRLTRMITRYFQGRDAKKPLTPSQRITVRQSLKILSPEEQDLLKKALLSKRLLKITQNIGDPKKEKIIDTDEIKDKLGYRMQLLAVGWLRMALNGTPSLHDAVVASTRWFVRKPFPRKIGLVEFMLWLMEPDDRIAFLLVHGEDRDTKRVASMLGVSVEIVEQRLLRCWNIFHERVTAMLPRFCGVKFGKHPKPDLRREEYQFVNSIYESLWPGNQGFLTDYVETGDLKEVARRRNIPVLEADLWCDQTDRFMGDATRRLVVEKLHEKEDGQTLAARIIRRQEEMYKPLTSSQEEMQFTDAEALQNEEMRVILSSATSEGRQAFWYSRTGTANFADATALIKLPKLEIEQAYNDTVALLDQRIEEYVDALLQKKNLSPGAEALAQSAVSRTSEENLQAYRRYYVDGEAVLEIAAKLGVKPNIVQERINDARKAFHKQIESVALRLMNPPHHLSLQHKAIYQDIMHVVASHEMKQELGPRAWKVFIEQLRPPTVLSEQETKKAVEKPVTPAVVTQKATQTLWKSLANGITSIPTLFAPMFGLPTASSATKSTWLTVSNLFMLAAIPFLWVMSLLVCGQIYGIYFVRNAPTLEARRWIVKQLCWIYVLFFNVKLGLIAAICLIGYIFRPDPPIIMGMFVAGALLLIAIVIYDIARIIWLHKTWERIENPLAFGSHNNVPGFGEPFEQLKRFVNTGLVITGILVVSCSIFVVYDVIIPFWHYNGRIAYETVFFISLAIIFYIGSIFMFQYLIKISKDKQAFRKYEPSSISKMNVKLHEFLCISPFVVFPILTGIGHICYSNSRPVLTMLEMLFCTVCWAIVWYWNVQSSEKRVFKIIGTFFFLIIATRILRHAVYPMLF